MNMPKSLSAYACAAKSLFNANTTAKGLIGVKQTCLQKTIVTPSSLSGLYLHCIHYQNTQIAFDLRLFSEIVLQRQHQCKRADRCQPEMLIKPM